jgi:hypothetical protein
VVAEGEQGLGILGAGAGPEELLGARSLVGEPLPAVGVDQTARRRRRLAIPQGLIFRRVIES